VSPHRASETLAGPARPASLELELHRNVQAPAIARAALSGLCSALDMSRSRQHTLKLLVSEVVSNAVQHSPAPADAPVLLAVTVGQEVLHIAVTDAGRGFTPTRRDPRADGGYGLYLLDKSASRWGVDQAGGTRVWFELARGPHSLAY
jgi:anti-sigma regulatory factor (Ser/Thr protein kinase)